MQNISKRHLRNDFLMAPVKAIVYEFSRDANEYQHDELKKETLTQWTQCPFH